MRSRFRGTLLGTAIADALGFPLQGYSRAYIRSLAVVPVEEFQEHADGYYPLGQFTGDTQGCLAVADAILDRRDVLTEAVADHLIPLWRDFQVIDPDASTSTAMRKLLKGRATCESSGLSGGYAESGALCRAIAVGLWDHDRQERIPHDVERVISITHKDPRVLAAGAGLAAAVAHNVIATDLVLGQFLDDVARAAGHFHGDLAECALDFPRLLSYPEWRAIDAIEEFCPDARYAPSPEGLGTYVVPTFLTAVFEFLRSPLQFERTAERCLRLGGSVCTVLAAAGAVSGSFNGVEKLPKNLVRRVADRRSIEARADELYRLATEARDPSPEGVEKSS